MPYSRSSKRLKTETGWKSAGVASEQPALNINDLPQEILFKILEENPSNSHLLVCKRWKFVLEDFKTFKKFKFYEKRRSSNDSKIFKASARRYESISYWIQRDSDEALDTLSDLLKRFPTAKSIDLKFKMRNSMIPKEYLARVFSVIRNEVSLRVSIESPVSKEQSSEVQAINFPNLKHLELDINSNCYNMLDLIAPTSLQTMKIVLNKQHFCDIAEKIFKLAVDCKNTLKELKVVNVKTPTTPEFFWSEKELTIATYFNDNARLIEFIAEKLQNLEELNLFCSLNRDLINSVFNNVRSVATLEKMGIGSSVYNLMDRNMTFRSVRRLKIANICCHTVNIWRLAQIFPNVEYVIPPCTIESQASLAQYQRSFTRCIEIVHCTEDKYHFYDLEDSILRILTDFLNPFHGILFGFFGLFGP